jgi:hypothetical protein
MAITLVDKPDDFSRVFDSNRCSYTFSSDQYTMPFYNFLIELYLFEPSVTGTTGEKIGTFKFYPLDNGTCVFNPTSVYKNYITSDLDLSISSFSECVNSAKEFKLVVYDYYSTDSVTPPSKQGSPYTEESRGLVFYNGCQQEIPYDYIPLNYLQGNNLQWVIGTEYQGKFLTDASEYRLDNDDIAFLYFLSDSAYLPAKIRYTLYYYSTTGGEHQTIPEGGEIDGMLGLSNSFYNSYSQNQSMPSIKTKNSNYSVEVESGQPTPTDIVPATDDV